MTLLFRALITSNIDFRGERSEQCRQAFWEWKTTISMCLRPGQLDCIHVHQIRLWSTFFCSMLSPNAFLNFLFSQFVDKNPFSIVAHPWLQLCQLKINFKLMMKRDLCPNGTRLHWLVTDDYYCQSPTKTMHIVLILSHEHWSVFPFYSVYRSKKNADIYRVLDMNSKTVFAKEHNEGTSVPCLTKTDVDTNLCRTELSKTGSLLTRSWCHFS